MLCFWPNYQGEHTDYDLALLSVSGEEAKTAFTIKYAAPETIQAFAQKAKTVIGDAAMDMWALGVCSLFYCPAPLPI